MELITNKNNNTLKYITQLNKNAKNRRTEKAFVTEGIRLCYDAYLSGCTIKITIISETLCDKKNEKVEKILSKSEKVYLVSDKILSDISDTKTPQGIICVIKSLDKYSSFDKIIQNGRILALEDIQDPNNLGTILRTAEAFGIDCVILTKGCCDIFSPKVVRGSMGAVFRQPFIIVDTLDEIINAYNKVGTTYATVLSSTASILGTSYFDKNSLVVIGNEGNGIKETTQNICKEHLFIPMNGKAESLNASVAASIIMWEMVK